MKRTTGKRGSGSALEKALSVLEAIIDQPQPVGLPDIADRMAMSRQTVHRLLQQLVENGLVIRDPSRDRFAIGPRFSKMALNVLQSANKGAPIRATIQRVVDEIGETCNVGVLEGRDFVYLERVETTRTPRIYLETGSRLPAHCTSGGKAMLAWMPPAVRSRLLKTMDMSPFTSHTITSASALEEELQIYRRQGFSVSMQEFAYGIIGIGVPILDFDGAPLAALALHGPIGRVTVEKAPEYAGNLQAAASRLARIWNAGS